jgi:predicted RNA polymerase sigma factor
LFSFVVRYRNPSKVNSSGNIERIIFLCCFEDNNEKNLVNKELKYVIENALQNIPPNYRIVFTLRELNGFSVSETAATLDILESNVKIRLNRAKLMLRAQIEKMYTPEEIYEFKLVHCDRMIKNVMAKIHIHMQNNS